MNKQAWKWIFEVTSDEHLVMIANEAKIKVPGFSRGITLSVNFKNIRPIVIQQMLKQLSKVLNLVDRAVEHSELQKEFRTMSTDELKEKIEAGTDPSEILSVLLSSIDLEHQKKGDELYQFLQEEGKLNEIAEDITEQKRKQEEETQLQAQQSAAEQEREKQLKKEEKLTDSMKKENTQLKNEKKAWEQERTDLNKTVRELQAQLKQYQSDRLLEKFQEQEKRWEQERGVLRRQLDEKQRVIGLNKTQIEKLLEEVEQYKSAIAALEEQRTTDVAATQEQTDESKKPVALIGRSSKANKELSRSPFYTIDVVEPERVEQALEEGILQHYDQVWLLTYEIPLVKQRKIRKEVDKQQLIEFDTFLKLKGYVYSG